MKKFFSSTRNQSLLGGVIVILLCAVVGYAVTLPHTFTADTPARAEEVNQNFDALKTAIDTLEAKLDNLDANLPLPSKEGKLGYAYIAADGTVDSNRSFNSSGGSVTVDNFTEGSYTVTFTGLGDSANNNDYHVQVVAQSPLTGARICNPFVSLTAPSADIEFLVHCRRDNGTATDIPFYVLVLW